MPDKQTRHSSELNGPAKAHLAGNSLMLEICVDSLDLALAAARGGADRIELCGPLYGGGITPSAGVAAAARNMIDLPLAMLVRPRIGLFTVSAAEFEVMRRDVLYAGEIGMNLVVLGILRQDRRVDVERTRELVELAGPMQVTFHRGFDEAPDPKQALNDVIATGAARVLTSGGSADALQGAASVSRLQQAAHGRVTMLLCGGIRVSTIRRALAIAQVQEVHAALRSNLGPHHADHPLSRSELDKFTAAVAGLKSQMRGDRPS